MAKLWHDIRYALRGIRTAPGFAVTVVITAGLGIAATATLFSIVNAVLLTPPPGVRDPDRLTTVHRVAQDGSSFHAFSYPNYLDYRAGDNGMSDLAVWTILPTALGATGEPALLLGMFVSHEYFSALGTRPAVGRLFLPDDDDVIGEGFAAVLSHRTWETRFGLDSSIVGRTIVINKHTFTVVGVTEPGFTGHSNLIDTGVWMPITTATIAGENLSSRTSVFLEMLGRRADGVSMEQAREAMGLIATRLAEEFGEANRGENVDVRAYASLMAPAVGPVSAFAALVLTAGGLILAIASVNVGGMLLARASRRTKEMAVRLALGASRSRLVRQLVTESVVLFLLAGTAGVLLTNYMTRALNTFQLPIPIPLVYDFSPDLRVLALSLALAGVTGIVFGLAPALRATRQQLSTALRGDADGGTHRGKLRGTFVIAQVAGSTLLLIGAGLLGRGLARAGAIDLGFRPEGVHAVTTDLRLFSQTGQEAKQFYDDLLERTRALPGVESAGLIDLLPSSFGNQTSVFWIEGRDPQEGIGRFPTDFAVITPGYLQTLEIPLVQGRDFTPADRDGSSNVAIINETIARRVWPGESPIGKVLQFGGFQRFTPREIVGVARDAVYRSLNDTDRNMVYVPAAQWPRTGYTVVARIDGAHSAMAETMRGVIRNLEPELPLEVNTAYADVLGLSLLPNRVAALLASLFGLTGALLAAVGLYGLLAYTVTVRTREIGVRIALGAEGRQVQRIFLKDGLRLAALGLLIGTGAAVALTRLIQGLLYGVSPTDPFTYAAIAGMLVTVAVLASYLPARRATRTDPVRALRAE